MSTRFALLLSMMLALCTGCATGDAEPSAAAPAPAAPVAPMLAAVSPGGDRSPVPVDYLAGEPAQAPGVTVPVAVTPLLAPAASAAAPPATMPLAAAPSAEASATAPAAAPPAVGDPAAAAAQQGADLAPPPAPREDDLLQIVRELQAGVDELREQNRKIMQVLGIYELPEASEPPADSLAGKITDLQEAVMMLADTDAALRRAIDEQIVALKPTLPAEPEKGKLTVENKTIAGRQVWINGTPYWVDAGGKLIVEVPVGTLTTRVLGEPDRIWRIEAPRYTEHLELVPDSGPAAAGG